MKKTGNVYVISYPGEDGQIVTSLWSWKPSGEEFTVHTTIPVEYEEPSREELVACTVKSLEAEGEKIAAEYHAKRTGINARIQSLLAIEHQEVTE